MRVFNVLFLITFFTLGAHSQSLYKEQTLSIAAKNISSYSYQIYIGTNEGVFYYNNLAIQFKQLPLVKASPLGNEAFFLSEGQIIKYNTIDFKIYQKEVNKIKNAEWKSIISNKEGTEYFLNSLGGNLYSFKADNKNLLIQPIPLDFFVSQMYWHENLNKILLADDFNLLYYDPISKKASQKIKLDSDITAINAHERNFLVTAGLSNGTLVVLNQNLDEIIFEKQISKASLSSIIEDPLDHYLYIGDENGTLYTFDLLKRAVIETKELHSGAIKMGSVYEPLTKKKFIITVGSDKKLKFLSITDLTPNYNRIVSEKVTQEKEAFLKIKKSESAVAYDNRVNDGSLKNLIEVITNRLHDSIAITKLKGGELFEVINDSLKVSIAPFAVLSHLLKLSIKF